MATDYVTVKDTAIEVRKALKAAFPGVKFSVRSNSYAGGASINVNYVDGPAESAVEDVAKQFEGASFDGMIDLKSYHSSEFEGRTVHWGADYVFVRREFSQAVQDEAKAFVAEALWADFGTINPGRFYDVPQAIFQRASVENGGLTKEGAYNFVWRESSTYYFESLVAGWIVAEREALVSA